MQGTMEQKYKLGRVLSEGAYGDIVAAERLEDGDDVCVKKIDMGLPRSERRKILQSKALREAHMLSRLEHPLIISYLDTVFEDNIVYVVTELGKKGSLRDLVLKAAGKDQTAHWSEANVLSYFSQLCLAMKHVHNNGMIHRDIKTENVFVTDENVAKLGDFGLAMKLSPGEKTDYHCGSPYQMAPEITSMSSYDKSVDIWALGVTLFELCSCGRYPFNGANNDELYQNIRTQATPDLHSLYSEELRDLYRRMLAKDPEKRPTIDEVCNHPALATAIEHFLAAHALTSMFDNGRFVGPVGDSKARGKRDLDLVQDIMIAQSMAPPAVTVDTTQVVISSPSRRGSMATPSYLSPTADRPGRVRASSWSSPTTPLSSSPPVYTSLSPVASPPPPYSPVAYTSPTTSPRVSPRSPGAPAFPAYYGGSPRFA